jgi:hypothetical protein
MKRKVQSTCAQMASQFPKAAIANQNKLLHLPNLIRNVEEEQ